MKRWKIFGIAVAFLLLCIVGMSAGKYLYQKDNSSAINEDVYAWIEIPETKINSPIVQVNAGDVFYTKHNVQKEEDPAGTLFTEDYNSRNFEDAITVVYGNNNSVFGELFQYADNLYMKEHSQVYISCNDKTYTYRVFAAYKTDNRHFLERFDFGRTEANRKAYLDSILNNRTMEAQIDDSVKVNVDSRILTLSTHDTESDQMRFVVQACLEKCENGERVGIGIEE